MQQRHITPEVMLKLLEATDTRLQLVENLLETQWGLYDEHTRLDAVAISCFPGDFTALAAAAIYNLRYEATVERLGVLMELNLVEFDQLTLRYLQNDLLRLFLQKKLALINGNDQYQVIWQKRFLNYYISELVCCNDQESCVGVSPHGSPVSSPRSIRRSRSPRSRSRRRSSTTSRSPPPPRRQQKKLSSSTPLVQQVRDLLRKERHNYEQCIKFSIQMDCLRQVLHTLRPCIDLLTSRERSTWKSIIPKEIWEHPYLAESDLSSCGASTVEKESSVAPSLPDPSSPSSCTFSSSSSSSSSSTTATSYVSHLPQPATESPPASLAPSASTASRTNTLPVSSPTSIDPDSTNSPLTILGAPPSTQIRSPPSPSAFPVSPTALTEPFFFSLLNGTDDESSGSESGSLEDVRFVSLQRVPSFTSSLSAFLDSHPEITSPSPMQRPLQRPGTPALGRERAPQGTELLVGSAPSRLHSLSDLEHNPREPVRLAVVSSSPSPATQSSPRSSSSSLLGITSGTPSSSTDHQSPDQFTSPDPTSSLDTCDIDQMQGRASRRGSLV